MRYLCNERIDRYSFVSFTPLLVLAECADPRDGIHERVQILLAGVPEDGWIGVEVIVPQL